MGFKVKDFYENIIAEFDTIGELENYISSSQTTSSIDDPDTEAYFNYFQYDAGIHESLEASMSLDEDGKSLIRITYLPFDGEDTGSL